MRFEFGRFVRPGPRTACGWHPHVALAIALLALAFRCATQPSLPRRRPDPPSEPDRAASHRVVVMRYAVLLVERQGAPLGVISVVRSDVFDVDQVPADSLRLDVHRIEVKECVAR